MTNSAESDPKSGPGRTNSEAELSERRDRLNQLLETQRKSDEVAEAKVKSSSNTGYGQAMKLSSEFIAGILVGGGFGWAFDQWLGTMPFGLIVFLLLGFGAGVLNVLRSVGYVPEAETKLRSKTPEDGS
ncbi:MAG: AtpZ/AtpI family protein [Rhodobacteraceae bacterium]|nr:AtpZ/AtpI family protein [Paracoccaceae bacterium]